MTTFLPSVAKLSENIVRVLGCNPGPMTLQGTNTYLIGKGQRRILLDTGEADKPEYVSILKNVLKENNVTLQEIIISHWHHDHIGGVGGLIKELNLTCPVSKFPLPESSRKDKEPLELGLSYLKDGAKLTTDGATLRVIHTPGHTEDHIVLYLEEEKSLFSADCILGEGTAVFEDLYHYMESLKKILELDLTKIYPGHGPVVDSPREKIQNYIEHREQRESQILQALKDRKPEALSAMDIVNIVYVDLDPKLKGAAAYNVSHHLHKLTKEKIIDMATSEEEELFTVK